MRTDNLTLVDSFEPWLVGARELQLGLDRREVLLSSLKVHLLKEEFLLLFLDLLQLFCMHLLQEALLVVKLILRLQVKLGELS